VSTTIDRFGRQQAMVWGEYSDRMLLVCSLLADAVRSQAPVTRQAEFRQRCPCRYWLSCRKDRGHVGIPGNSEIAALGND